jgi:hypothetical protein
VSSFRVTGYLPLTTAGAGSRDPPSDLIGSDSQVASSGLQEGRIRNSRHFDAVRMLLADVGISEMVKGNVSCSHGYIRGLTGQVETEGIIRSTTER